MAKKIVRKTFRPAYRVDYKPLRTVFRLVCKRWRESVVHTRCAPAWVPFAGIMLLPLILLTAVPGAAAETIYVDKDLIDDCVNYDPNSRSCGSGSHTAYNTISEAAGVAVAGDTVLIRQGMGVSPEYREQLAPLHSGDAVKGYITFKGYPGEDVRIKGDRIPSVSTGVLLNDRSYIIIEGLNVRYVERYIRAENARHIIIRNNIFTGAVWGGAAMKFLNADHNKIVNNTITNSTGRSTDSIAFLDGNYNLLEGNTITDGGHALFAIRGGDYNVIRNNYFYNGRQKIGEIYDYGVDYNATKYNLIEGNIFAHTSSSGSASPYAGIQFAGQNTIVRRNVWYENIGGGLRLALYGKEANHVVGNRIYHNVFYKNHHGGIHVDPGDASMESADNIFKNNILYRNDFEARDTRWTWWVRELNGKPIQLKTARLRGLYFERNNIINNVSNEDYVITHGFRNALSPPHNPLSVWQTDYPAIFLNNLEVDPGFADEVGYDFKLTGTSRMIDAGAFLTIITSPDGNGSQITVADAGYFYDGYGIAGERGDLIKFENGQTARISDIDYSTGNNTITLDRRVSWSNGEKVSLDYDGAAPDIGAYEFNPPPCETIISGDIDGDCKVDVADFAIMALRWLKTGSPAN